MTMRLARMVCLAALCLGLQSCASLGTGSKTPVSVSRGCAHLQRHQYEVCYAYVVNDTFLARVPYYKAGRDPTSGPPALTRL